MSPLETADRARHFDGIGLKCITRGGAEYVIDFLPKLKVEVVLDDSLVERAVQAVQDAARTDKIGDGKIFVVPIEQAVRIRTGEQGPDAV